MFRRFARKTFGISQILSRLRACYRTQDAEGEVWKLGSLVTLRGYHKGHEEPPCTTVQARSDKPSTAKGHKVDGTAQGAGRACAQGARPAQGPGGHGGLRTPCFGGRAAMPPRGAFQEIQEVQEIQECLCGATDEAAERNQTNAVRKNGDRKDATLTGKVGR